jgi:hypothetical protein
MYGCVEGFVGMVLKVAEITGFLKYCLEQIEAHNHFQPNGVTL